ncbi:MAG: FAD-dependent monooxygenase [Actinomycetes bacterium]|jgi:salicylate hydroxylase|nr:FAD-dependent monooxygenase [Actinomycetes bacterium]
MSQAKIIVSGGGIAGAAVTLMLGREGFEVVQLEQAEEFKEVGAGMHIGPNITRMFTELGLFDRLTQTAVFPERLNFRNAITGDVVNYIDLADVKKTFGGPYIVIHRNDVLQTILQAADELPNVTISANRKVVDFVDEGGAVTVTAESADGKHHTYVGDVFLAADGVHSIVRKRFVGDTTQPTGYVAYRSGLPIEEMGGLDLDMTAINCYMGPGLHLMQYGLRAGALYNQVAVFRSPSYPADDWGNPDELLEAYSQMCPVIQKSTSYLSTIRRWPLADLPPIDKWTFGRIALLGDAAHATTQYLAQGAGQSLLDAASLTKNLKALGDGPWSDEAVAGCWAAYEAERVALGTGVQRNSRLWGDMWHVDTPGSILMRDWLFANRDRYNYDLIKWVWGARV